MIWGFFSIPLRQLKNYSSADILIYRIFTSLLILAIICLIIRRKKFIEDLKSFKESNKAIQIKNSKLILISTLFVTANWFLFIYVINHISIQAGAFAYMVCPIITAILGHFILKEELTKNKWTAIFLCIASIIFLSLGFITEVIYSTVIALLYAAYLILQKKLIGFDKLNVLFIQLVLSTIIILPYHLLHLHGIPNDLHFWLMIFIISLLFTVLPLFLSLYALIGMPSSTMGIIIYLNPIVSFLVAFVYFDEGAATEKLIAYAVLTFAVILFNYGFFKTEFQKRIQAK